MKRKKVGLTFLSTYKEWAGGVIYILNIINALQLVEDEKKPQLLIYYKEGAPIEDIATIGYPYIEYIEIEPGISKWKKWLNYGTLLFANKSLVTNTLPDVLYPDFRPMSFGRKPYHWIPDLQHYFLPHMSSAEEVISHKKYHESISKSNAVVVFSSKDAMNSFRKFYPDHVCELKLLRFASIIPFDRNVDLVGLMARFDLKRPYFMAPNQFWKHKNHKVVLEAIKILRAEGLDFQVVFTGSQQDHRNKEYFGELKSFIEKESLETHIRFLGFIDRKEQLKLMEESIALIQPSLFEGWSTVVEDAKAINKFIILSSLPVHLEQISKNCEFFDPTRADELAVIMKSVLATPPSVVSGNYELNIKKFAEDFLKIFDEKK